MSPEAVDRRLREVSELRRLCLSLGQARRLGPADPKADQHPAERESR
jgi:hypothetical protein